MEKTILLVDDEQDILDFLSYSLKQEGFKVLTTNSGSDALNIAKDTPIDLIVLDMMMPEMDGIETCIELKKLETINNTTVVFLSARSEDYSQIAGLEAGADDYITKPIKPRLFVAKIKSLLRRGNKQNENLKDHPISIDLEKRIISNNGNNISLPRKEFDLLALLLSKPGNVFTREIIMSSIWGDEIVVGDRTIDVHIRKIREKIGAEYITTIKGVGYKFEEN